MARTRTILATLAAVVAASSAASACASIEAHPRYATRIEDVLPSEGPSPDALRGRAEAPDPIEFSDPVPESLPPVRSQSIETSELPPLARNESVAPPRAWETSRPASRDREPAPIARDAAPPAGAVPPADPDRQYVVQAGDTLSGISRRFATPVPVLIDLNDLTPQGGVREGQRITLPASAVDRGVDPYAVGSAPRAVRPAPGVGLEGQRAQATPSATASRPAATVAASPPPPVRTAQPAAGPTRPVVAPPTATATAAVTPGAGASPAVRGRGKFIWPVRGDVLSRFGSVGAGLRNDGVNIAAEQGTPVKAAAAGDVVYAGSAVPGFGNLVLVKHADGWVTAYGHLDSIGVKMRDRVAQGAQIGTVGATGGVPTPQLHFEIRYASTPTVKAAPVDPLPILP